MVAAQTLLPAFTLQLGVATSTVLVALPPLYPEENGIPPRFFLPQLPGVDGTKQQIMPLLCLVESTTLRVEHMP
mgnify:CR=1 FL=1